MTLPEGTDISDAILFWVVTLVGANHLLMRIPGVIRRLWAFIPIQLLNLGTATGLMAIGIPEFDQDGLLWILNWVLGLLLIFHVIQNNMRLQRIRSGHGRPSPTSVRAEQERIAEALRRGASDAAGPENLESSETEDS